MLNKVAGLARTLAILIAIVGGFVTLPTLVPLVLLLLGIIAGFAYGNDDFARLVLLALALPIAGTALSAIPSIGAELQAVMTNIFLAVGGVLSTRIIIRLYEVVVGDIRTLGAK
jgi:hypothetical protein